MSKPKFLGDMMIIPNEIFGYYFGYIDSSRKGWMDSHKNIKINIKALSDRPLEFFEDIGTKKKGCTLTEKEFGSLIICNKSDIGTLAHECLHAVHHMLYCAGVEESGDVQETTAYCLSWLIEKIIDNYKDK